VTSDVLEEVTLMISNMVTISLVKPTISTQEIYVVTYDLNEMETALVIWVFWVWGIASEVNI
jgi:hypothetical protein